MNIWILIYLQVYGDSFIFIYGHSFKHAMWIVSECPFLVWHKIFGVRRKNYSSI